MFTNTTAVVLLNVYKHHISGTFSKFKIKKSKCFRSLGKTLGKICVKRAGQSFTTIVDCKHHPNTTSRHVSPTRKIVDPQGEHKACGAIGHIFIGPQPLPVILGN